MSHFTVLVIGDNPEEQLAPFQENNMGDCPQELMEFYDVTDEYTEQYNENSIEKVLMGSGEYKDKWDDAFRISNKLGSGDSHKVPDHLPIKKVRLNELYDTFDEYMCDYVGYDKKDPVTGKYGYWENPNAKWDWYVLGGRWSNHLKLKPGTTGTYGDSWSSDIPKPGHADSARVKDVDFESMIAEAKEEAEIQYKKVLKLFGGTIPVIEHSWTDILNSQEEPFIHMDIKEKRDFYHNQEAMLLANKVRNTLEKDDTLRWLDLKHYQVSLEEYIKDAGDNACSTYAMLKDGEWIEQGSMGWFGISSNNRDDVEWETIWNDTISDLDGETLISVYDCHI